MYRFLTAFILFLIAGSAMADSSGSLHHVRHFAERLAPPESDYSVAYLSQIFGTVGNVLSGTSGQILGKMFDIFNKGVMVVAAIWLGVTTVTLTIHGAHQGNFSNKYNAVMILLRIAFGFALLIPSSTTGYSLLQDVFMKVVVQGVGLADQTWDAALKYLKHGGQLYIPPQIATNDPNIIIRMVGSSAQQFGPIAQIFADEVCMIESSKSSWRGTSASLEPGYHAIYTNAATGLIYFPGNFNGVNNNVTDGKDKYTVSPTTGAPTSSNAACGVVADHYYIASQQSTSTTSSTPLTPGQITALQGYSYSALVQLVKSLHAAAKEYVKHPTKASYASTLTGQNNIKTVFAGMLAYVNLITPYQTELTETQNQAVMNATGMSVGNMSHTGFIDNAEAQGWIMAGGFYWQVERANNQAEALNISKLLPLVVVPTDSSSPLHEAVVTTASSTILDPYANDPTYGLGQLWSLYVGAQQNNITASSAGASGGSGLGDTLAASLVGSVSDADYGLTNGAYNPITVLMKMGNKLLEAVVITWVIAIPLSFALGVGMGVCSSTQPLGIAFKALLTWVKSIMMLITTLLMVPGAILSYYVPLYPFAVFTFAAVGWLLMVIEGMAAAPLICVGVTHPEGNDFLGKSEQAVMLFLGIFLRPALMVMGLIAAMIVSFVGFRILNIGFGNLLYSLSNTGGIAMGNNFLILISECMVLIIFGMMTMELVEQCYKLIVTLPQYILKWLGAPDLGGGEAAQMAQGIKGGVTQGAKGATKAAQFAGDSAASAGQGVGAAVKAKKDKGNINTTGGGSPGAGGGP